MVPHPFGGIPRRVGGQIQDLVGIRIVLPDFIPRRGKEGKKDLILRMRLFQGLDDGTALFKLAQGSSMKPNPSLVRLVDGIGDVSLSLMPPAFYPLLGFGMAKESRHQDTKSV